MANQNEEIIVGSGNVFADLDLPDAKEALAKSQLALAIEMIMDERGYTQTEAAKIIGMAQPEVSKIVRGRLQSFSLDRLILACLALGLVVELDVRRREADEKPRFEIHNHLVAA